MACPNARTPAASMLLVLGKPKTSSPYRYPTPGAMVEDTLSRLVPLPETYDEAAKLAFNYFKDKLDLETVEDVILKKSIYSSVNLGSLNADFEPAHWEQVMCGSNMYGSTIEVTVFKANREDDIGDDCTLDQGLKGHGATPGAALPYLPPAPLSPYGSYAQLPGAPRPGKVMQMVNMAEDQTAIVKIPDTYEACEAVARQVFPSSASSEPTTFVLKSLVFDAIGKGNWAIVHPTAYETSVLRSYASPLHIRVEFETTKERAEKAKTAKKAYNARPGFLRKLFGRDQKKSAFKPYNRMNSYD